MENTFPMALLGFLFVTSCSSSDDAFSVNDEQTDVDVITTSGSSTPVSAFDDFNSSAVTVSVDGEEIKITSTARMVPYMLTTKHAMAVYLE